MSITGKVGSSNATGYYGPSTSYISVGTADANNSVTIYWVEDSSWYYIQYPASSAPYRRMYVQKDKIIANGTPDLYTPSLHTNPPTGGTRYIVSNGGATLHAGPGFDYPFAIAMLRGSAVTYFEPQKENNFAFVEAVVNGKKYRVWVNAVYLSATAPTSSTATIFASACTTLTNTISMAQRNANATYIRDSLMSQGYTKNAACAVIGNMYQESGMNPGIWQSLDNTSQGYGLVQSSPATKFLNWAVDNGVISTATSTTIDALANSSNKQKLMDAGLTFFMASMLDATSAGKQWYKPSEVGATNNSGYSMTAHQFMTSTLSARTLAMVFHDHYERSKDSKTAIDNNRGTPAENFYNNGSF